MADLIDVANELYALSPDAFTATRNERAKQLADPAIRALPKPSAAAWAINLLVRERAARIDAVLDLGERLQAAQRDLDRGALRSLILERRSIVAELTTDARALASDHGHPLNAGAVIEINQTLQAAMADRWAGTAVRSGRLVRSLASVGFEPVALEGAVGAPGGALAAASAPSVADPAAALEQDAVEAEQTADDAELAAVAATAVAAEAARRRDVALGRQVALRDELEQLGADLEVFGRDVDKAERGRETTAAVAASARDRADRARAGAAAARAVE